MRKRFVVLLWSTLLLLSLPVNSSAEISSDELLQILKDKGIISDQDIEKAKEARGEEKEEVVVKAARRPKSVNFKGRVQVRYTSVENGDLENVTSQKPFDQSEFDGFVIRRMRLRWFGEVVDQWKYHVQVSADGDHNADKLDPSAPDYELNKDAVGVMLQDAYITYDAHPYLNVTMGQFKSRFSPSYLVAGPVLPLCERPLVIDKLAIYYAVGLYNGNGFNKMRNDNENFMVTGMVVVRPSKHINFGVSYAYDHVGYDYETTVLGDATVDGNGNYVFEVENSTVGKRLNIWDFNTAIDAGPVHIQAEYVQQHGHGFKRAYGYGVQGQVDMTDTFQLTARYDEFDPNVDVDNSFDSRWYTIGYNWFLHGQNIKWQLNYTFREEMHGYDEDNDVLVTHFQALF
ncbi:MAG: hypothetical protein JRE23_10410 [Deltaproteobacteria bacterium]|nr:hypothetical protein [Deltaproteobacteria bacterium]